MTEADLPPESHSDVAELAPLVRRVVSARVTDPNTVEDVVQETLLRLVAVRDRLDPSVVCPYAVVIARNLVRGLARASERHLRHGHRLLDPRQPQDQRRRRWTRRTGGPWRPPSNACRRPSATSSSPERSME